MYRMNWVASLLLLAGTSCAVAQTYPSPTYQNLTVRSEITGGISGTTSTASGALTARATDVRFADSVNVKDWGAVCDGTSHPLSGTYSTLAAAQAAFPNSGVTALTQQIDWAAIQQGMHEASNNSKALYIPGGTCLLDPVGVNGLSNVWVRGDGRGVTTIKAVSTATGAAFAFGGRTSFKISDMTFDGTYYAGGVSPLEMTTSTNFDIDNVEILHMQRFAVEWDYVSDCKMRNSRVVKDTPVGNVVVYAVNVSTIRGGNERCQIIDNYFDGAGVSISGKDFTFSRNTVLNYRYGGGVQTAQDTTYSMRATVTDNTFLDSGSGTDLDGTRPPGFENWAPYSIISGNKCYNLSGSCISNGGQYSTVTGNVGVDLNQSAGPEGACFDNRYGTSDYNGNYSVYAGNICTNTAGTSGPIIYGFHDQASVTRGVLIGNQFHNVKTKPVYVVGTDYSFVGDVLSNTEAWTPGLINAGAATTVQTVTVTGARLGDVVGISFSLDTQGVTFVGVVSASDTVSYWATNTTSGGVTLGAGTVTVTAAKTINSADY